MISAPRDVIVTLGSVATINCTVDALAADDSLAWWHQTADGFTRLFLSHGIQPGDVNLVDSDRYEIQGHYNFVVRSAEFSDAGVYVCEITGHGNYTAELSVLCKFHFSPLFSCVLDCVQILLLQVMESLRYSGAVIIKITADVWSWKNGYILSVV